MSKTIKQIADELGVSKQAVQKRLSREPLYTSVAPYISTIDGVKYIEVVGENLVKSAFSKSGIDKTDTLSIDKGIDKPDLSIDKSIDESTLSIDKTDLSIDKGIDKPDLSIDKSIDESTLSIDKTDLSIDKGIDKPDLSIDEGIDKPDLYTPIIETLQATIDTLQGQLAAKDEQIRAQQEQITALQAELERERQHARDQSDKLAVLADQAQQLHAADKKTFMLIEDKENERKMSFWERRAAKKAEKKARKEQSDQ